MPDPAMCHSGNGKITDIGKDRRLPKVGESVETRQRRDNSLSGNATCTAVIPLYIAV